MLDRQTVEGSHEEALRRIAAGEREALGEFYDQSATLLFSVAVRMLGDAQEAEEVIQDVFVLVWRKAATFDPSLGRALPWALGITRNRCIDRIRARQRQTELLNELRISTESIAGTSAEASPTGPGADEIAAVRAALQSLPADQREAIQLAFFAGLTHQEIAQRLEEPLGTVKARIRRGMLKLREALEKYL